MNAATCTVCAQNIADETDRVYCFGGCEQIQHVRCSGLSPAGANAMRDNSALRFLCARCIENQTALNDIRSLCVQLATKFDEVLERVKKHDSMLKIY